MLRIVRRVVVVCAALAALSAQAQKALVIAGGVFDDRAALAVRAGFVPVANVSVKLHRDDGDGIPSAGDAAMATAKTNRDGIYSFNVAAPGTYWVAVDSHTFGIEGAWPEQTFGPAGALCTRPDGTTSAAWFEGPCFGGRSAASDDASSLATAEHLALVNARDNMTRVDFAFSYDAVTSTRDGERIQGTFRQFLTNANAVGGPNRMRFVPLERPRQQPDAYFGVPPRWWMLVLGAPLPELRDGDTVIDGTAYNFLSPASVANVNPGRLGEPATIRPEESAVSRLNKPELDVTLTGPNGIVCEARCGIRHIALHGAPTVVVTRADARFEHVILGASPDAEPADIGSIGLLAERGAVGARHLLVSSQSAAGVMVRNGARIDGDHLEITRCGEPERGGGIILLSDGSYIRSSTIAANLGAGVIIGSLDGSVPAAGNTIDGSTISGNQAGVILGPGSSRNVITRNDVMWNRFGGIAAAPFDGATPPRENRLSANRFDENGLRPIVLSHAVDDPNQLVRSAATCDRVSSAANEGIASPRISEIRVSGDNGATRVVIRGRACPGQLVELYQSFVTSGVREEQPELPRIRGDNQDRETLTTQERDITLPSIGEFNYLGTTTTTADGAFEAVFPLPSIVPLPESANASDEETNVWARQILPGADPADRAFSAIAIDAAGNTSEMSVRRQVD